MTYQQQLEYESALHRKYFEPFDQLLEKKAQYYLSALEAGKSEKQLWPVLHEIEVLEQFREYTAMLDTLLQEAVDKQHQICAKYNRHVTLLSELYQDGHEQLQFFTGLFLKRLQEQ